MAVKDNTKQNKSEKQNSTKAKEKKDPKAKKDPKNNAKDKKNEIEDLKAELLSQNDLVLRLSAEFENFKKRKQKEIDDFKKFANESVFKQLLTVVDNLERAISSADEKSCDDGLLEGVKLTHKEVLKIFDLFNVKTIDANDKPFDPNFHQAVTQAESEDHPENTVINELQKGYILNERLLRPSMVVVSKSTEKNKQDK